MGAVITKLDRSFILVRPGTVENERIVALDMHEWSNAEQAYVCPNYRIVDIVEGIRRTGNQVQCPDELYVFQKRIKVGDEAILAILRAFRATGIRAEDLDYFRDHFQGQFPPYRHQLVTFQYISMLSGCAVFNEMGTGKTASVLWAIDWRLRRKEISNCLVIAPNNLMENWRREVQIHTPRLKSVVITGSRAERYKALDTIADVYLINYEGLMVLRDELKHVFGMVVLDEAHRIKDPQAVQTKLCHELFSDVLYKVIMTGTPIGNELLDLHQPMTWMYPHMFEAFGIFRSNNFTQQGSKWKPNRDVQKKIQDKVYAKAVRYRKEECLDLPPKTYITRTCEMEGPQKIAYQQMLKAFVAMIDDGLINAKNVLSQMMKLSQITSGFVRDSEGKDHVFREVAKLKALEELITDIREAHALEEKPVKVIIWARFINDIKRIGRMLNKHGEKAVLLYGATAKGGNALMIADRFRDEPKIEFLVGNPAVGGLGLNMTCAAWAIYYSNDYSWIKRSQSEDRNHRMGSEAHKNIYIVDIVTSRTIDEPVVGSLRGKKELAKMVIDIYKAGIGDAFSLLKERDEARRALQQAARNVTQIEEFINMGSDEYRGAVDLEEPECFSCHSKNIMPGEGETTVCKACGATWQ